MTEQEEGNRLKVSGLLKDNPQGLTIEDLSAKSKLSRQTISRIIEGLKGEKVIWVRTVGPSKLCFWNFKEVK